MSTLIQDDLFKKYLGYSLTAHIILLLVMIFGSFIPFGSDSFKQEKITWITLPKGTGEKIGIGVKKSKSLPKTTIEESKKTLAAPPEIAQPKGMTYKSKETQKAAVKKKAAPIVQKKPKKLTEAEKRMAEALKRVKENATLRPPEAAQIPDEIAEGGVPWGASEGPFVSPDDPIYVLYQSKIRQRIIEAWIQPMSLATGARGLICKIAIKIDGTGKVTHSKIEQRSGNEAYDQSALRAIHKASPLDIPPEKLKAVAIDEGFLIEFNPEMGN
jgi:colicin import membrane protein